MGDPKTWTRSGPYTALLASAAMPRFGWGFRQSQPGKKLTEWGLACKMPDKNACAARRIRQRSPGVRSGPRSLWMPYRFRAGGSKGGCLRTVGRGRAGNGPAFHAEKETNTIPPCHDSGRLFCCPPNSRPILIRLNCDDGGDGHEEKNWV